MLKKETLDLINLQNADFIDVFSICIGKIFLFQKRFIDYLGKYHSWHTDVRNGILEIDNDRKFDVEYIGTSSTSDDFWYSSELESLIPKEYTELIADVRKRLLSFNVLEFNELAQEKIYLDYNYLTGYNLSMIYMAFASENTAYFCGQGDVYLYMFVKNLPDDIFKQMVPNEFSSLVMEIISKFGVKHRLMIEALMIENDIKYLNAGDYIVAYYDQDTDITIKFDDKDRVINISENLSKE